MPARSPTGWASRTMCSITKAAFREEVVETLRRRLSCRAHPDPLHPLQHGAQVHRPAGDGARTGRRLPRHRALCAPGRGLRWARTAPRARSGARPELFPVRHHRGRSSISCAFRWAACPSREVRGIAEEAGLRGRRQARQPGHLLRARWRLRQGRAHGPARRRDTGRDRPRADRRGAGRARRA